MASISPVTRGRTRPVGSRKETWLWLLMRVSGLGLFVLALAHFSVLHFVFDPAEQDAAFITEQRWNQLTLRVIDWSMLMLVLFHSFVGMRTVVQDYTQTRPSLRRWILVALYILAIILFVLGTWVVVTLPGLER
jgi:succinate dehydrogenase / fumarate reductase, membrane anchor subunit